MAYRSAGTPVALGLGVAMILGTSTAAPALAFADEPSASPSEQTAEPTSEPTTSDPEPEPTTPSPDPSTPDPEPTTPDPEPTTPSPQPTSPDPEPTTPDPEPTTPSPQPTSPGPRPGPGGPKDPDKPGGGPTKPTDPTRPDDPPPGATVAVKLSLSSPVGSPGGSLTATAYVRSGAKAARDVRLVLSGAGFTVRQCTISVPCRLGAVGEGGESAPVTVYVPGDARPGSQITVYATVTAAQSTPQTASVVFGVTDGVPGPAGVLPPGGFPGGGLAPGSVGGLPQVVLPPVASPQIAPGVIQISPVAAIRDNDDSGPPALQRVAAVQAGWLSALLASISLLLASRPGLRPASRTARQAPGRSLIIDRDVRRRLNGKRPTAARLRALPPQPAPRPKAPPRIRVVWLPFRPGSVPVRRGGAASA
ncbi:hypothetical protein SAMN04489712_1493 [Thermomonospora echinospora]|uniref:Uncharacterized protein n=1 Tax=Thermomonospora echinospora TaxID=1992 RepID=A0A1H6EBG4_9ACTN|nr:hypothetical protein [Thermomonospora echinospora]SEG94603.1 hypothetical protein SAMN04489712_1493 [Thermomonospora echinospora]